MSDAHNAESVRPRYQQWLAVLLTIGLGIQNAFYNHNPWWLLIMPMGYGFVVLHNWLYNRIFEDVRKAESERHNDGKEGDERRD